MADPIEPTSIIPAGWPLPSRRGGAVPAPPPPPPWPPVAPYTPPRTPMPRPEPQPPAEVRVTVDPIRIEVVIGNPPADPPTWSDRLQLRRNVIALTLAFVPGTAWGSVLHQCWQQAGIGGAWVIAGAALLATGCLDQRRRGREPSCRTDRGRGSWWTRPALCTALLGPALGLPLAGTVVYIVTGVAP